MAVSVFRIKCSLLFADFQSFKISDRFKLLASAKFSLASVRRRTVRIGFSAITVLRTAVAEAGSLARNAISAASVYARGNPHDPKSAWQPAVSEQYGSVAPEYPRREQQLPNPDPWHVTPLPQAPFVLGDMIVEPV